MLDGFFLGASAVRFEFVGEGSWSMVGNSEGTVCSAVKQSGYAHLVKALPIRQV